MGHKKLEAVPRSKRTEWSPERGGRTWQYIGDRKVPKFAFSPYTAKPRKTYSFYADVEMAQETEYPGSTKSRFFTMEVTTDTFLKFRDKVLRGEAYENASLVVEGRGGGSIKNISYWRAKEYEGRTG